MAKKSPYSGWIYLFLMYGRELDKGTIIVHNTLTQANEETFYGEAAKNEWSNSLAD